MDYVLRQRVNDISHELSTDHLNLERTWNMTLDNGFYDILETSIFSIPVMH